MITLPRRPSLDETLLHCAYTWAARGTCPSAQVGCVLARDGRSLVSGYNGAPAGLPHCDHEPRPGNSEAGRSDPTAATCTTAVHDVANAIAFASRYGVATDGATAYCTYSPCLACAKLLIQAGIVRVVYGQLYRDTSALDLLDAAGVARELLGFV